MTERVLPSAQRTRENPQPGACPATRCDFKHNICIAVPWAKSQDQIADPAASPMVFFDRNIVSYAAKSCARDPEHRFFVRASAKSCDKSSEMARQEQKAALRAMAGGADRAEAEPVQAILLTLTG